MSTFIGLEEILRCVIENTAYQENGLFNDDYPDEKRLDNAMKTIFGKSYPDEYIKPPKELTYADMMWIHTKHTHGTPLETAIKQMAKTKFRRPNKPEKLKNIGEASIKYNADKAEYDENLQDLTLRTKTHYYRYRKNYRSKTLLWPKENPPLTENESSKLIAEYEEEKTLQINNIKKALRQAGWPI